MFKTILITSLVFVAALVLPANVYGQYGQQVLGTSAPEVVVVHKPVETGIEDHPEVIGAILLAASGILYIVSKKARVSLVN